MPTAKKLPSGNYRALAYSHTDYVIDETGKTKTIRHYESFTAPTKTEAEYAAAEFAHNKKRHKYVADMTLGEAIDNYIRGSDGVLSPTTIAGYKRVRKNYFPMLMALPLKKINNAVLQSAVNHEAKRKSQKYKEKGKPLSPKTIANAFGLVVTTINRFAPNVDTNVKLPAPINHIKELLPPDIIAKAVSGTEIELPVLLAMWLGLSMSEIRGLSKKESIKDGYLIVKQVIVDADNEAILKTQTKAYTRTRKHKIPTYIQMLIDATDSSRGMLVELSGQAIYKRFARLLKRNGLPHMTFHDLRHVNASVMALLRIPDKYAMERGGWKTDKVMKQVYQHTFSDYRQQVDNIIDDYFSKIIEPNESMQHELQHEK